MQLKKFRGRAAFTLVEIMIVVAIIGLLAAIAVPNLLRAREKNTAQSDPEQLTLDRQRQAVLGIGEQPTQFRHSHVRTTGTLLQQEQISGRFSGRNLQHRKSQRIRHSQLAGRGNANRTHRSLRLRRRSSSIAKTTTKL